MIQRTYPALCADRFCLTTRPLPIRVDVGNPARPGFHVQGIGDHHAREVLVRVRSALRGLGVDADELRVSVLVGDGGPSTTRTVDLPVALAVLHAIGRLPGDCLEGVFAIGELGLDGAVRPVRGVLPHVRGAAGRGMGQALVPRGNAEEAGLVPGIASHAVSSLREAVAHLRGESPADRCRNIRRLYV